MKGYEETVCVTEDMSVFVSSNLIVCWAPKAFLPDVRTDGTINTKEGYLSSSTSWSL